MAKREKSVAGSEQKDLIDVHPENHKKIKQLAHAYKKAQRARAEALAEEIKWKEKLLSEVKESKVTKNPDGSYKFKVDDVTISVTPRDELVRVKFEDDESDDDSNPEA